MGHPSFDIAALNHAPTARSADVNVRADAALRRVAAEFEALLLRQLTSSLNPASDDEESLFGSDSGTNLSRQLFGEQLADTMAQNGGIGLADTVLRQIQTNRDTRHISKTRGEQSTMTSAFRSAMQARTADSPERINLAAHNAPSGRHGGQTVSPDPVESARSVSATDSSEPFLVSEAMPPVASDDAANSVSFVAAGVRPITHKGITQDASVHVRPRRVNPVENIEAVRVASDARGLNAGARSVHAPATGERRAAESGIEPVPLRMFVQGAVRSSFGARVDPINGRQRFHKGIDIPASRGTPIGAAAAGRVVFAGRNGGYGNTVVVEHADGTQTRYAHAERLLVAKGDFVESGQSVATVGSTGHSTGPHLHFEVMRDGRHLNPLKILAKDFAPDRR